MVHGNDVSTTEQAAQEHRSALETYLARARALDAGRWHVPVADGKWTPAQITEHLSIAYAEVLAEFEGTGGMKIVLPWWKVRLFRLLILPWILRKRRLPPGAKAPRAVVPGDGVDREPGLEELAQRGDAFDRMVRSSSTRTFTHPYFGRLGSDVAVRFCAIHIENHTRQLPPE